VFVNHMHTTSLKCLRAIIIVKEVPDHYVNVGRGSTVIIDNDSDIVFSMNSISSKNYCAMEKQ